MIKKFSSIASPGYYPEKTIISNSISKGYAAGGWRFGYFIFPRQLADIRSKVLQMGSEIYSCVSAPMQYAMIKCYSEHHEFEDYISKQNRIYRLAGRETARRLRSQGVKTWDPEGAFYIFVDMTEWKVKGLNSRQFFGQILDETGVALLTGECFGRNGDNEYSARLAFVDFDGDNVMQKIDTVNGTDAEKYDALFPKMSRGIDILIKWLNDRKHS